MTVNELIEILSDYAAYGGGNEIVEYSQVILSGDNDKGKRYQIKEVTTIGTIETDGTERQSLCLCESIG